MTLVESYTVLSGIFGRQVQPIVARLFGNKFVRFLLTGYTFSFSKLKFLLFGARMPNFQSPDALDVQSFISFLGLYRTYNIRLFPFHLSFYCNICVLS